MNLFADSSAWIALYDEHDKYHKQARQSFQHLANQPVVLVLTDYVVAEAATFLLYRAGHARAIRFGDWALHSANVRLIRLDTALWNEAWRLFKMHDDKDFSFVDCASFAVMRREHIADAFTFDHHFEQMGFRLWPGEKQAG